MKGYFPPSTINLHRWENGKKLCQGSFGNVNKYKELVYLNADLAFDLFKQWQASQSRTDVPSGISYTLFVFCVEYIGKTIITNCF